MFEFSKSKLATATLLAGLLLAPLASYAISVPHHFAAGDPVVAEQLNENFETLRSELENLEQDPLHVKAYANSGVVLGTVTDDIVFGDPTFDNTGGVISNGSSWYWEVPEDGVYLVHAMIAGDYASNGGDENEFYGVHIKADGETFALDISRQNTSCCRRHTTASSAQYLEAGQLVSVVVHNLSSMDFTVVGGSYIDITRLR